MQRAHWPVAERLGMTRETNPTHPAFQDTQSLARLVKRERSKLFVFVKAGETVGCGGYAPVQRDGKAAWIKRVAVLPEHQRKGYGVRIVRLLEGMMREAGYEKASLLCLTANRQIAGFYRRLGYAVDGRSGRGLYRWTRMSKAL